MASVKEHYDSHLAPIYTWTRGGADAPRAQFADLLRTLSLTPFHPGATALDLGAGSGFQSLPLAAAGYTVTAVDLSELLIADLAREASATSLSIRPVLGDMCDVARLAPTPAPELIVCMGDTLTHLASLDETARFLRDCATTLAPGGHLLLSFRDYSTPRTGADRFIPVCSDTDRIFTCFLEFGPTHLTVHDLLHTRTADGWKQTVSLFEKIRLSPAWVATELTNAGLTLSYNNTTAGLVTLAARRCTA